MELFQSDKLRNNTLQRESFLCTFYFLIGPLPTVIAIEIEMTQEIALKYIFSTILVCTLTCVL